MKRTRIKICGITRKKQAEQIAGLAVDALGFILYQKSPRYIDPGLIRDIIGGLPPFTKTVGVFVNESVDHIGAVVRQTGLDLVQLSGDETPEYCRNLSDRSIPWIKAIRVRNQDSLKNLSLYNTGYLLLDAWSEDLYGGTGKAFDWEVLQADTEISGIILAGGITPGNAGKAVSLVKPYAIDVSSGVEVTPGVKSLEKVKQLIEAVTTC